jgi:CubicO group peptidase (beta-lactamase class C family)
LLAALLAVALLPLAAFTPGEADPARVAPQGTAQGALDDAQLQAFFDTLIPAQLAANHIPGAVVAVVRDGRVAFAQGYGFAEVVEQTPVAADRTYFEIGSIGKLFVWTAVMQLVEEGRLNLDADVNGYLDFAIPDTYPEPITLKHLLGHTAGFENRDFGLLVPDVDGVEPLGRFLYDNLPARVRPPGLEAGYSNYGSVLAGYIVERVSGEPLAQYVDERILQPLGMRRTTLDQRISPELAPDVAHGYVERGAALREQPFDIYAFGAVAAGGEFSTAADMARFMLAQLQDGRYEDQQILREDTARLMHGTLFRPDPRVNGMAYGFMEMDRNGHRAIGHIGSAAITFSSLVLLPDDGVGVFVAYNGDRARPLTVEPATFNAFMDRFFPAPARPAYTPPADFASRAGELTGNFRRNNFGGSVTTVEKVLRVLGRSNRTITAPGDGTLQVRLLALITVVILFVSAVAGVPLSWINQHVHQSWDSTPGWLARAALGGASAIFLVFLAGLTQELSGPAVLHGDFSRLRLVLVQPLVASVLVPLAVIGAIVAWRRPLWSWPARLHYTVVTALAVAFLVFLSYWNLLGFRY